MAPFSFTLLAGIFSLLPLSPSAMFSGGKVFRAASCRSFVGATACVLVIRSLNRLAAPSRFAMHERPQPPATAVQKRRPRQGHVSSCCGGSASRGTCTTTDDSGVRPRRHDGFQDRVQRGACQLGPILPREAQGLQTPDPSSAFVQFLPEHAKFHLKFLFN